MIALSKLRVQNLLSFGAKGVEVDLTPLNVLIGPNGSGKSNLIEVIGLLNSAPEDLAEPFRETGGVVEWIWKGGAIDATAAIEATVNVSPAKKRRARYKSGHVSSRYDPLADLGFPPNRRSRNRRPSSVPLRYRLAFRPTNYQLEIVDELVQLDSPPRTPMGVFFAYENGRPMLNVRGKRQMLRPEEINPQKSVLSQRKDPEQYPELTELGRLFGSFRFYRDWEFGINSRARKASPADAPVDFLEETTRNLALMVNRLNDRPETKAELLNYMKTFYADAESINTTVVGGQVDVRLHEKSKFNISAARLSDGTLRWMALLTILLHPSPPPLVCLEEPELGLHPDVIRPLAKLMVQASERMQLVVTTHSDTLVDELTETPEAVIVCEKDVGSTTLKRLERRELSKWLKQYTLGELWHKGQIGGTRW
jgi:predicted ATPase